MKLTGATKEVTGHSPLPWYFDELRKEVYAHDKGFVCGFDVSAYIQEHELQVCQADAQLIVTAVNERERLRQIAKDALRFREEMNGKCGHDEAMTKLCTQCEIRAALNDATPSTSAGDG